MDDPQKAYDAGRFGGQPSGQNFGDYMRGVQDYQRGLQQPPSFAPSDFSPPPAFTLPMGGYSPPAPEYNPSSSGFSTPMGGDSPGGGTAPAGCLAVGFLACGGFFFWAALYPLAAMAATIALGASAYLLPRLITDANAYGPYVTTIGPWLIGLITLVIASRLDHKAARHAIYRIPRHLLRLAIFGFIAFLAFATPNSVTVIQFMIGRPSHFKELSREYLAGNPQPIAVALGAMLFWHFLLWRGKNSRQLWHAMMEGIGLRRKDR